MEGALTKWTNLVKGWQHRWFVLDDEMGLLSYYTSKEKMIRGVRRGCVRLKGAVIGIDDTDDSTFTITVDQKTFHFQAKDEDDKDRWIFNLQQVILKHTYSTKSILKKENFERKLAESNAYLRMLIANVEALESRIQLTCDIQEREKCEEIKDMALTMIESMKTGIQLLHANKKKLDSINLKNQSIEPKMHKMTASPLHKGPPVPNQRNTTSGTDRTNTSSSNRSPATPNRLEPTSQSEVPDKSYSSNEDEEDFFDASETVQTTSNQQNGKLKGKMLSRRLRNNPQQDDDQDVDENNEKNTSVILHLIRQVRPGMDLTRVVLPTFILERRSLLEMFADFIAHPDLFTDIPLRKNPRDRMVALVKWYLSAFHAGRKSDLAKKPYNPILGETFRCSYNLPHSTADDDTEIDGGPLPWSTDNCISIVAEQVSHHPPISAFYAEHFRNRISIDGYTWTRSKFLGNSVSVEMIGRALVSLTDHDEEYIITFPTVYGRSILFSPWIELAGDLELTCTSTGYRCSVQFHAKPFYGGKRNLISAEIFGPKEKKPFCTIRGTWNDKMFAKFDGKPEEIFLDIKKMHMVPKIVQPIEDQDSYESRKLWKEVTRCLKTNNVEEATTHKHFLEERQRSQAKVRKENSETWKTKCFHEVGEHWVYDHPLVKRSPANQ